MKTRLLFVPLLLALVACLAACADSANVPANAIAVVNGKPITQAQFNTFLSQAIKQATIQTGTEPKPGTDQYTQIRQSTVAELVEIAEVEQQAKKEGVSVTPKDVDTFLANLVQSHYEGDQKKLEDALKQQGMSMEDAKGQVYINLLATKLKDKITSDVKVSEKEEQDYFNANPSQFTPQPALEVAASKKLANTIEQKLKNGASFAELAKKYSQDPGSASQGGKYTATEGREVPAYDKAAFSLPTGGLSAPIDATSSENGNFGFFIIKALGPVKKSGNPAQKTRDVEHILVSVKTKPKQPAFKDVQATIEQTLLSQKKDAEWKQWIDELLKSYKGKVDYQSGFEPPATTAVSTTQVATTG